jgi:hypothetical protein
MSTAGNTPNFIAAEAVLPFRVVKMQDAEAFSVKHFPSGDPSDAVIGITDGSVRSFRSNNHADAGDPVVLQNGEFVQVTCGPSVQIVAGDVLSCGNAGTVEKAAIDQLSGTKRAYFVACENAQYGEILWAKRIGAYESTTVQADLVYPSSTITTTDATATNLLFLSELTGRAQGMGLTLGYASFGFSAILTGTTATGAVGGAYLFQGYIRSAGLGSVAPAAPMVIVASTKTVLGETNAAMNANLVIDAASGGPAFECIGLAATEIRWSYSINVALAGSLSGTF